MKLKPIFKKFRKPAVVLRNDMLLEGFSRENMEKGEFLGLVWWRGVF